MELRPKYSILQKTFARCAGANWQILEQCPNEITRHAIVGATLITTAIMASISAGYFVFSAFKSIEVAFIFGCFWGFMIYNLDLYIVTSLRKQSDKWTWKEFSIALPRILLAILLSIVVSKPLELKIFEKEINVEIVDENHDEIGKFKAKNTDLETLKADDEKINKRKTEHDSILINIHKRLDTLQKDKESKLKIWHDELLGNQNSNVSGKIGNGPNAKLRENEYKVADSLYNTTKHQVETFENHSGIVNNMLKSSHDSILKLRDTFINKQKQKLDQGEGPLKQLKALHAIVSANPALQLANWLFILIFMLLETSPVIVKLMAKPGIYEELCDSLDVVTLSVKKKELSILQLKKENDLELERRETDFGYKHQVSEQNQDVEYREKLTQKRKKKTFEHQMAEMDN
jgi:hypothetical protein